MRLFRPDGKFAPDPDRGNLERALERFRRFCEFDAATGCVLWTGGTTMGRGHSVPYGSFKYDGKRWFAHRFAAKFIHGQDIDGFQTDHCCPHRPIPDTLCMEHLQSLTPKENRTLQFLRRKMFIHLQVGLVQYEDVYGCGPPIPRLKMDDIPFYDPPAWLGINTKELIDDDCPF